MRKLAKLALILVIALIAIAARQMAPPPPPQDRATEPAADVADFPQGPMYGVGPAPWASDLAEWLYGVR